ncbi:hypothetical protein M0Q97_00965 [Candidatus Dojkabacteria bacterium]|jgi:hypothetical protein|nr:hypothetical protein [Candidatus Dojkabacteria bacterium]
MITIFKIFEKTEEKQWFATIVKNDLVESIYLSFKHLNIKGYFYPYKNEMVIIFHITNDLKLQYFSNWMESDYKEKRTLDREGEGSVNIEKWLKEYHIKQKAKKYNV